MTYPDRVLHWLGDTECPSRSGASFDKRCPIDDRVLAQVERGDASDVAHAVDLAARAAEPWGRLPAPRRGEVLARAGELLRARTRELGEIVQLETGKPWKNAVAEAGSSADLAAFMAGEGSRFYGRTMTSPIDHRGVQTLRQPIGVCAGLMPFNSPLAGIAWKVFPALLCGNAVVVKSHELTPYTGVLLGQ
ncbi:MAG: aldehyde dehydrogenase family protein, partial [Acidobacteriota bacterium]